MLLNEVEKGAVAGKTRVCHNQKTQVYVRQSPNYITTICTLSAKQYCKAVIFEAVAAR